MKNSKQLNALASRGLQSLFADLVSPNLATSEWMDNVGKVRVQRDLGADQNLVRITARVVDGELVLAPWGGGAIMDEEQQKLADLVRSVFEG